jgi:acyl-CoA thioesterase
MTQFLMVDMSRLSSSLARKHFGTTLAHLNQPHALTIHIEFLRRTSAGPGIFTVQDLKLGSTISTVHISLSQLDASNNYRQEVVAFVSHTNLLRANGITLDGRHTWPDIVSSPSVDLAQLERAGEDENWVPLRLSEKTREFAKAVSHVQIYVPRSRYQQIPPSASRRAVDEWLRFTPQGAPETFVNDSLGYVADMFPLLLESFMPEGNKEELQFWTATLSLSLEVKKLLPSPLSHKSAEWLFLRAESKSVQNGRMDIEMTILDAKGDLVASGSEVALALDASRNTAPREKKPSNL